VNETILERDLAATLKLLREQGKDVMRVVGNRIELANGDHIYLVPIMTSSGPGTTTLLLPLEDKHPPIPPPIEDTLAQ
jgi:hypothetical protein